MMAELVLSSPIIKTKWRCISSAVTSHLFEQEGLEKFQLARGILRSWQSFPSPQVGTSLPICRLWVGLGGSSGLLGKDFRTQLHVKICQNVGVIGPKRCLAVRSTCMLKEPWVHTYRLLENFPPPPADFIWMNLSEVGQRLRDRTKA